MVWGLPLKLGGMDVGRVVGNDAFYVQGSLFQLLYSHLASYTLASGTCSYVRLFSAVGL